MASLGEQELRHLVTEVFRRLAVLLGSDGRRGKVITVFSGASVGLPQALDQIRWCSLQGFCQKLAFSTSAEAIYGDTVRQQLAGFPNFSELQPGNWIDELAEAKAILVPMLSLNTASKVALLLADSLPANLILHGISRGIPVVAATNGADPDGYHWAYRSGPRAPSGAFREAMLERMQVLRDYGCQLTDIGELGQALLRETSTDRARPAPDIGCAPRTAPVRSPLISAGNIREAHRLGLDIHLGPETVVTPLAREIAARLGVKLQASRS